MRSGIFLTLVAAFAGLSESRGQTIDQDQPGPFMQKAATQSVTPSGPLSKTMSPREALELRRQSAASPVDDGVVTLPQVTVEADDLQEIQRQITELEAARAREEKLATASALDVLLNGESISEILSLFGGESATARAEQARQRVAIMGQEKLLLLSMLTPRTETERKQIMTELKMLKELRRGTGGSTGRQKQ